MAKKINPNTQFSKSSRKINTEWLKNASRSLGMNSLSVIEDLAPNISDVASTSGESIKGVTEMAKEIKKSDTKVRDLLIKNRYVKLAKTGLQNAMEDFKSGNFNNEQREADSLMNNGNSDSGMFFDDSDESSESNNIVINQGTSDASMAVVNKSINRQTEAQLIGAQATVDTMVAVTAATMTQNQGLNAKLVTGLDNINNQLASLVSFQNNTLGKFIESASTYMEKMGASYASEEKKKKRLTTDDIIDGNGNINASQYKELVKEQFKEWFDETTPGMVKGMLDQFGDQLVANPLKAISTVMIQQVIPETIKQSISRVDTAFGGFLPTILQRINSEMGNSGKAGVSGEFMRMIGNVFGLRRERKNEFDMKDKFTEAATPFSKMDHFAISEMIPKYLRESNSYLKSIAESLGVDSKRAVLDSDVFDYKDGKYIKQSDVQEKILKELTGSIIESFRSSAFGKELVNLGNNSKFIKDKDKENYSNMLDQFFVQLEKHGNPNIIGDDTSGLDEILSDITGDDQLKYFLKESVLSTIRDRKSGLNLGGALLASSKALNTTRQRITDDALSYNLPVMLNDKTVLDEQMRDYVRGLYTKASGSASQNKGSDIIPENSSDATVVEDATQSESFVEPSKRIQKRTRNSINKLHEKVDESKLTPLEKMSYGLEGFMYDVAYEDGDTLKKKYLGKKNTERLDKFTNEVFGEGSNNPLAYIARKSNDIVKKLNHEMTGEEYIDSNGKKHDATDLKGKKVSLVEALKKSTSDVFKDLKTSIFGKKGEDGKKEGGLPFVQYARKTFNEGISGYADALFGEDTSGEDIKDRVGKFISDKLKKAKDIIPKDIRESVSKNGDAAVKGGLIGTLIGGPIVGGLTGSAIGLFSKSKTFQEFLYGKEDESGNKNGGLFKVVKDAWNQGKNKDLEGSKFDSKKFSMALTGTTAGLLASFVMPFGPIGGAALGLASSMIASNDKFKKFLFGSNEPKDNEPGLMGRFANIFKANILRPMMRKGENLMEDTKTFIKESFLDPVLFSVEPIVIGMKRKFDDITGDIAKKVTDTFDFLKENITNIVTGATQKIFGAIGNILSPFTSAVTSIGKAVLGLPGKALNKLGDAADKRNRKASVKKVEEEAKKNPKLYSGLWSKYQEAIRRKESNLDYDESVIEEVETKFFNASFRNSNKKSAEEDINSRKEKSKDKKKRDKDKSENEKFISKMTKGALVDDTPENRKIAMDIFNEEMAKQEKKLFAANKVHGYRKFQFKGDPNEVDDGGDATQATTNVDTNETQKATKEASEKTAENTSKLVEEISGLREELNKLLEKQSEIGKEASEARKKNLEEGRREHDYDQELITKGEENQKAIEAKKAELESKEEELNEILLDENMPAPARFFDNLGKGIKGGFNKIIGSKTLRKFTKAPANLPHFLKNVGSDATQIAAAIPLLGLKAGKNIFGKAKGLAHWLSMDINDSMEYLGKKFNDEIDAAQDSGYGGYGSPFTKAGHYVVASGLDNKGNVIINNPNDRSGSKKYNLSSIVNQTGRAWGLEGGRGIINNDKKDDRLHVVVDEINTKNPLQTIISGTRGILPIFSFGTRRSTTNSKAAIDSATQSDSNLNVEDLEADFNENDVIEGKESEDKKGFFEKITDLLGNFSGIGTTITNAITQGSNVISALGSTLLGSGGLVGGTVSKVMKGLGIGATTLAAGGLAYDYFKNNKDTNKNTFLTNSDGSLMIDDSGNPIQMTEQNKPDQSRSTFIERMSNWLTPNKTRVNTDKDSEDYGKWTTEHRNDSLTGTRASAGTGLAIKTAGTVVEKFLPLAKEAIEVVALKLAELLEKHGFKSATKVLDFAGEISSKITVNAASKHTSKIGAVFAKLGVSGGTLALADAAFIAIGAISGLTSPGELFEVNMDDENIDSYIKTKMTLISTVFKGFMNTSVGSIIDVVDIIVSSASGFSPIKWLAQNVLKLWLDDVDDERVSKAQENMKSAYNSKVQEEYEAYLAGLSDKNTAMSLEEFSQSNLSTSFDDYNSEINQSILDKAGNSIGSVATKVGATVSSAVDKFNDKYTFYTNRSGGIDTGVSTMKTYVQNNGIVQSSNPGYGAINGGFGEKVNGSTFYSQKDPRWKNAGYGTSGDTMENAGCGPTAMAMALSDATGRNINPMQMASMAQSGGYRDSTGTNASFVNAASNAFGVSTKESINPNEEFIRSELSSGNPVVLLGQSGGFGGSGSEPFTSAGHFNYATGIDNNGNVTVNDPRGKSYSKRYKLNKLARQTGRAWSLQSGRGPTKEKLAQFEEINRGKRTTNANEARNAVVQYMINLEGKLNYAGGSNTNKREKINEGWADCSSLIWYIYKNVAKINIPNNSASMINDNVGKIIDNNTGCPDLSNLKPGDVILFKGHAEMYIGNSVMMGHGGGQSGTKMGPSRHDVKEYCSKWGVYRCTRRYIFDDQDYNISSMPIPSVSQSEAGMLTTNAENAIVENNTKKQFGLFDLGSTLSKFFSSAASKAMKGFLTGEWSTDYSDVFGSEKSSTDFNGYSQYTDPYSSIPNSSNRGITADKNWNSSETEPLLFRYFTSQKHYTKEGTAGLLGNLFHESGLRPNNLQNSYEKKYGDDVTYTRNVDSGVQDFINDSAGYGLAQWTSSGRKKGLLEYAKSKGTSIGDLTMQMEFLDKELSEGYKAVKDVLTTTQDVVEASNTVLHKFEKPADQSAAVENKRATSAMSIYEKYKNEDLQYNSQVLKSSTKKSHGKNNDEIIATGMGEGPKRSVSVDYRTRKPLQSQTDIKVNSYLRNRQVTGGISKMKSGITNTENEMKLLLTITQLLESIVTNTGDTSTKLDYLQNIKNGLGSNIIVNGGNTYKSNNNTYSGNPTNTYDKNRMTAYKIAKG